MKVLLVHMRYYPDATGTAPLVTQLAQDIVQDGVEVEVITSLPHYGRTDIHPDYQNRQRFFHRSEENGVEIIRTPVYIPRHSGLIQRAINYLSYNLNSIIAGLSVKDVDLVLAINPPITTTFSAWILSVFHRAPLLVGIQDIWPDCVIHVGQLQNRFIIGVSKLLEKIQYRIAKRIVVLSSGMKNNLLFKGVPEEKIEIIPNWADPAKVTPLPKDNQFYREQDLKGKFVVLFAGNHGYIAALESIIETADLLKDKKDILFLFVGEGSVKKDLVYLAAEKKLNNVRFLSTLPQQTWLEMLAAADLGLVTLRKELAELNVPSKVYTLMSAACPILASVPEESEVKLIIQEANCGFVSPPENPVELADAISASQQNTENLRKLGMNGRTYLMNNLHRKGQTSKYSQLIKSVIRKDN